MKLELEHTIIDGVELYSVWLNKTHLHKSCKTKDEAVKYFNEIKELGKKPFTLPEIKVDLRETILTEEI
ncbi:MAG: hypothetical protein WC401_09935 [Bacteroidales bacterium]